MAVYLKQFSTHAEYDAYINGSGAILPNVSICTTEGDVHYNPYVEPVETRVVAKFNVTNTSSPTQIISDYADSPFSAIEIDGVAQPSVVSAYTFSTTGEHTVKYTLTDPTSIGTYVFRGSRLLNATFGSGVTSIGNYIFYNCSALTSITCNATIAPSIQTDTFEGVKTNGTLYVPQGSTGYDTWMQNVSNYLGYYNWTKVEQ